MSVENRYKRARFQDLPQLCTNSNAASMLSTHSTRNDCNYILTEQKTQNVENLTNQLAQLTLKQYFEQYRKTLPENNFKDILKNLISAIESKHSQKLVIKKISLDNISIHEQSLKLTLSEANRIEEEDDYLNDIFNVGVLIVSIFDDSLDNQKVHQEIKENQSYDQKFNHITVKLKNAQWIQPKSIQTLADLIVNCLHVEHQNYKIIKSFKNHAYFAEENYPNSNNGCSSKENNLVTDKCTNLQSNVTLRKFIENYKAQIDENAFKKIVKILLNELEIKHLHKVILNNITLDTVTITIDHNEAIPTLLNVPKAKESATKEEYLKDIKDVGVLILSIFIGAENVNDFIKDIAELLYYNDKFNFALSKLNNSQWIQKGNLKLFIDFIVCLISVNPSNNPRAKEFKRHPYFWEEDKISKFIDKINSRLNLSADGGSKDVNREDLVDIRKAVLEAKLPKNYDWKTKLGTKIKVFYPDKSSWSELIKFIRNRDTHSDDCTDSESEYIENNKPIVSKTNSKASKDPEALKQLSKYLSSKNGPLSYFLTHLDDILYLLFNHFRLYADHPVMKKFYCKSFLFEDSTKAFDKIVKELNLPKKEIERKEPPKPTREAPGSSNRPPNISSEKRNDQFRTISKREKNTAKSTRKSYGCY